ncbi:MAG: CPBP family intramembrane metalloprotease [Flavobacteriaceae bacterium]
MNTLTDLIRYLRNPVLEKDSNKNFWHRLKVFFTLLSLSIVISFLITFFNGFLEFIGILYENKHATDTYLKGDKGLQFLFVAAVVAPIAEELIFRAPLVLFKKARTFKIAFYTISIIFGYVHIFNFEINTNVLLLSPFLIAPQLIVGMIFGFIRIRLGLIWSILLHATYNGILVSLFLLASNALKQ